MEGHRGIQVSTRRGFRYAAVRMVAQEFLDVLHGSWKSQTLRAVAVLGVADVIWAWVMSAGEVAQRCRVPERTMRQLLRALSTIEMCEARGVDSFALGRLGGLLRSDVEGSLRKWTIWWGEHLWEPWGGAGGVRAEREGRAGDCFWERDSVTSSSKRWMPDRFELDCGADPFQTLVGFVLPRC